jgi:hypothetical protein
MPTRSASLFCSRRCEIEGNYWLFQELCVIEITRPLRAVDGSSNT